MNRVIILLVTLGMTSLAFAGDGYVRTGSQGIMNFVQIDKDKAKDADTYRRAAEEFCPSTLNPATQCQVLFWTENAPVRFPFSREQVRGQKAYWQYHAKSGKDRLYVDCDFFKDIEDAECL